MLVLCGATGAAGRASGTPADDEFTVSEQSAAGAVVGRLPVPAPETADSHVFEIIAGNPDETFAVDGRTGELRVARPELLDFESRSRFELTIRLKVVSTADAAQRQFAADLLTSNVDPAAVVDLFTVSAERLVTIDVLDINEPPVIPAQSLTLVGDAADSSAASGLMHAHDPDQGEALTFEVIAGDPEGLLILESAAGRLAIAPGSNLAPGQQVVPLTVRVTDRAGHSDAATVSVRLVGIPAPQVAIAPPMVETSDPAVTSPAEDASPGELIEVPSAAPEVAAAPAISAAPQDASAKPRQFTRPALWFFLAGVLLGAGLMTIVFRYVGRTTSAMVGSAAAAPANPFGQPRPRPIMVSTREQLRAMQPASASVADSVARMTTAVPAVIVPVEETVVDAPADQHMAGDECKADGETRSARLGMSPDTGPDAVNIPHWREALRFRAPQLPPPEEPAANEFSAAAGLNDLSIGDIPSDVVPRESDLPIEPAMSGPASAWTEPAVADEPPQLMPADEGEWYTPPEYLVDDLPEREFAQETAEPSIELHEVAALPEAEEPVHDVYQATGMPEAGEVWEDAHELDAAPSGAATMDELPASILPNAVTGGDGIPEAAEPPDGVVEVTAEREAAATVDDPHDAAAVREAAEALDDAQNPLGVEPRVAELRRQLTELFGVPADQRSHREDEPAQEPETPIAYHVVKEVASDSARVDGLFESLRASLDSRPASAEADDAGGHLTSARDAGVVTPVTPAIELSRSTQAEPAARVNKSAVRQEISSLRAVANNYARAIVARQTTEKRARIVWLVSAGCMVPLFSGGTYLLTTMPPGAMRWLGWLLLTGGAGAFSVCLNSFNRLSKLHEETQRFDEPYPESQTSAKDTAEFEVPPELVSQGIASEPVSPVPAAEMDAEQPEPVEAGAV